MNDKEKLQKVADNMIFVPGNSLEEITKLEGAFKQWWEKNKEISNSDNIEHLAAKSWYAGVAFYKGQETQKEIRKEK